VAETITALAQLVAAAATLVVALRVHREVKTMNGKTIAVLTDENEGRRIAADIAHDDRTASEQHYVDQLDESQEDNP